MSYIEFINVQKYYKKQHVLKNLSLSIEQGEFVTLLGASGCGKSTLLRCMAGFERLEEGKILLDGEDITGKNPSLRNVGMIFQQYSLFPTMTVGDNVSFGLKMQKVKKADREKSVEEVLRLVDLKGMEKKFPYQLSGGEQQRVALARSLITRPKVMLFDEPFSAIDAKLRKELQARIKEIHKEIGMTSIFVTHDQDEAMVMSDTIHLMNQGRVEQSASPEELYKRPATLYAAGFIGNYNILSKGNYREITGRKLPADTAAIRPEVITFSAGGPVVFSGSIDNVFPQGNIIRYQICCGGVLLKVDVLLDLDPGYRKGEVVSLSVDEEKIIMFYHKEKN